MNTEIPATEGRLEEARSRRILKRYSTEERERLIREYKSGNQTQQAFCEERGINPTTFSGWFKHRQRKDGGFAEVELTAPDAPLEVSLPNGLRIGLRYGGQPEALVDFVRRVLGMEGGTSGC